MSNREAWRFIRSKFARFSKTGRKNQWTETGICNAIILLATMHEITGPMMDELLRQLKRHKPKRVWSDGYWFPFTREGAAQRVRLINKILDSK